jgi:hypothetical protein
MSKNQLKAAEYRDRANASSTLAEACVLDRMRERHEAAAERWSDLARLIERAGQAPAAPLETTGA